MKKGNPVRDKSYDFAIKIIGVYQLLVREKKEYVLSKQLLKSWTFIGANVEEAIGGQSKKDFFSKIAIAYKEARESQYWLRLLMDSNYLSNEMGVILLNECNDLIRIIGTIQKTTRKNL